MTFPGMWWWQKPPRSEAAQQREIARLEGVQDRMLQDAARAFAFKRVFAPAVFVGIWVWIGISVARHPGLYPAMTFLAPGLALVWLGSMVWRTLLRPPRQGDLWGYYDCLGYDGDSPRDVQQKIDALRNLRGPDP